MRTATPVRHGYQHLDAVWAGPGASERLWVTTAQLRESECGRVVGKVAAVFDRSLHLALPEAGEHASDPVIAFGTTALRQGPLLIHVDTPTGFSFESLDCDRGDECVIRTVTTAPGEPQLIFQFPHGSVVGLNLDVLSPLPASTRHQLQARLAKFEYGGHIVAAQQRLIQWLVDQDESDGLGFLSQLGAYHRGAAPEELQEIVDTVVALLTNEGREQFQTEPADCRCQPTTPQALRSEMYCLIKLLGKGPGATPSGDDFLSGLLLGLGCVGDTDIRVRMYEIGKILASAAQDRCPAFSQELLTEACKHRGSEPVTQCLRSCMTATLSDAQRRDSAQALLDLGHTSGMDLLAGLLTATSAIIPSITARGKS